MHVTNKSETFGITSGRAIFQIIVGPFRLRIRHHFAPGFDFPLVSLIRVSKEWS